MDTWTQAALLAFVLAAVWAVVMTGKARHAVQQSAKARSEAAETIRRAKQDRDRELARLQDEARARDVELQARSDLEREVRDAELARLQDEARGRLAELHGQLEQERERLRAEAVRIEGHYESQLRKALITLGPLKRFQPVADAEAEARRVLLDAIATARRLREQGDAHAEQAKSRSESEVREAAAKVRSLRAEAEGILANAANEARSLVNAAHGRAEAIAGSAYAALREKDSLQQAITAIRNVIDGYGDRYVVPTHSVVDELAANYSHVEAGARLKASRDHTRRMVEQGLAAECDYAEARRKETAVRFVLDAFNGGVDAILSRAKHDNLGTLEQEIRDAFALVNLNGEAFRNARIQEPYLDARIAELKWAVAARELELREKEEQRRIQEQIREEEKAQREIERALRESAREEETLKQALEKARAEVAAVAEGEKAALEARIADLNDRIEEAEAKNQRALSMAQQTRAGNVYIISNVGSFGEDVVKIGMTRRMDPNDRIKELSDASVPFVFDIHAMIRTDDAPALEKELHDRFEELRLNRVNYRKEFFRIPIASLRDFVAEKGLTASFTLLAEAREFRESLALSKMTAAEASARRESLAPGVARFED